MKHLLCLICTCSIGILPLHAQESTPSETAPPAAVKSAAPSLLEIAPSVVAPPDLGTPAAPLSPPSLLPPLPPLPPVPPIPPLPAEGSPAPANPAAAPHNAPDAPVPPPADGTETYAIDAVHSHVGFKVKHLFSYVTGRFNNFEGTISGHPDKPDEAKVSVTIQVASIDTKDAKRDQHLRSEEFFDAGKFPTMTFVSKKVHRTGQDSAFVVGDLTMRGVTREVILQTKFLGKGKGMTGRIHTGWEGKTALKRSDFGLTWNKAIEGTQLVNDDIEIDLQIEAVQPEKPAVPATPPPQPEKKLPEQDGVIPPTTPSTQPDNKPTPPGEAPPPATPAAPATTPAPPALTPATPATPDAPGATDIISKPSGA